MVFTLVIVTVNMSNLKWSDKSWDGIVKADGFGYYAYLPAVFVYHDLNFSFFEKMEGGKYYDPNLYFDYRQQAHGNTINKYYCGTALVQSPFYFAAHLLAKEKDGYSKPYKIAWSIGALFYLAVGLIALNRLLLQFNIKERTRCFVLPATLFGTNLYFYTIGEPGMSHLYSFAFVALFLLSVRKYFLNPQIKYLLWSSVFLGIIVLIRPVNLMTILALPLMSDSKFQLINGYKYAVSRFKYILVFACIFIAIVSIQAIIYKIQTGRFLVYSYGEEGFNFLSPHFSDILFSYRKGLFVYTPMYLIAFIGFVVYYRKSAWTSLWAVAFFILISYVLSSWHQWYYGGSFSSRVYVEYLPYFALGLALFMNNFNKLKLSALVLILFMVTAVCQIQTYQYRYYHIHWSEMNREKYWNTFLRIDRIIYKGDSKNKH
jgi:hypothetical protein